MGKRLLSVIVVGLLLTGVGAGCSAKKKKGAGEEAGAGAGAGVGEEGLGTGGSLDRYKSGTLGAGGEGEEGPLRDIHFAFDSAEVDDAARGTLQQNGNWLKDHSKAKVEIEGHTDERGTVEYNLALGAKRARAAKDYLVALGVSADRMSTISYGEELPICKQHDESCWQTNRRVHFVVSGD